VEGEVVYRLIYEQGFVRDLQRIGTKAKSIIKRRLEWLAANAQAVGHVPLRDPRFKGLCRLRVGDYRIFYHLDHRHAAIYVIAVRHRREAYS
jgi:mRNA interferase RelE/StbE